MTEYRQDEDVREEERERIRAICMERFEYYFDPYNDQLELLNTLEREFPDIDPEWLEDYMIDAYSDRDYETRDSYSVMEWSGGEGFGGPVVEIVAIKEVDKDYLLIAYTEGSPGYSEMARYRKSEFNALSKKDQSVLLLRCIRALSRDGDVWRGRNPPSCRKSHWQLKRRSMSSALATKSFVQHRVWKFESPMRAT